MEDFLIELDAADGTYKVNVEPTDNNGLMQYVVSVLETDTKPFQHAWFVVLEQDADIWKQSPESVERGPKLPCFLVEEIGEQIEQHYK